MSIQPSSLRESRSLPIKIYYPSQTVRSTGTLVFRNQLARDIACLLDVDDTVSTWSCMETAFAFGTETYRPDITGYCAGEVRVIAAVTKDDFHPPWLHDAVMAKGYSFQSIRRSDLPFIRLQNARDLLRYANFEVGLDDRIRLLAALDEHSSLTIAECMGAFKSSTPIPAIASLILRRFIAADLDTAPIGPETVIRRSHP